MSFHPLMVYDADRFQKSERARLDDGKPFEFTRERRAILILTNVDVAQNLFYGILIDYRSDIYLRVCAIADSHSFSALNQFCGELLVDFLVNY